MKPKSKVTHKIANYKFRKIYFCLFIFIVICITLLVLFLNLASNTSTKNIEVQVISQIRENAIEVIGVLQAVNQVEIGAQVSGQIQSLWVNDGDKVNAGDIVAQVNPDIAEAELASARASYQSALLRLDSKKYTAKIKQNELARLTRLFTEDAVSNDDVRHAKEAFDNLSIEIQLLEKEINLQASNLSKAEKNLKLTTIRSPIDGIVVNTVVRAGQTLTASQVTPILMKVVNLDNMEIKLALSETDVVKVKEKMSISYRPLYEMEYNAKAEIHRILPVPNQMHINQGSKTYSGIVKIYSPPKFARIGMNVVVKIQLSPPQKLTLLDRNAKLLPLGNHYYEVMVKQGKTYRPRQVKLGEIVFPYVIVESGLTVGEWVLVDNTKVVIHE